MVHDGRWCGAKEQRGTSQTAWWIVAFWWEKGKAHSYKVQERIPLKYPSFIGKFL